MSAVGVKGTIRPNKHPSHIRASVTFTGVREFVVEEGKPGVLVINDKPGAPLVLSPAGYSYMLEANGRALVVEPLAVPEPERIAALEQQLAAARDALLAEGMARDKMQARTEELKAQVDEMAAKASAKDKRIAELEARLAEKTSAAPPPPEAKPAKPPKG